MSALGFLALSILPCGSNRQTTETLPYLQHFVKEFTAANNGKAFYAGLDDLGEMIFDDYENNKKKRI